MARGGSVASQIVRKRRTRSQTAMLLLLVATALGLTVLRRCVPALAIFAEAMADRRLDRPWMWPTLCGTAGLVLFVLLWSALRLAGVLRKPASKSAIPAQLCGAPTAAVAPCIETPQPRVEPAAMPEPAPPRLHIVARTVALPAPPPPLADLQNAAPRDSRFRTRAHFSGQKRRAGDYSGPRRRATDRLPDPNYAGPLRRASDPQNAAPSLPGESSERRIADRRSPPQQNEARQHKIVPAEPDLKTKAPPREAIYVATGTGVLPGPVARDTSQLAKQPVHGS